MIKISVKIVFLAVSFSLGILFGSGIVYSYEEINVKSWEWYDAPIVATC